ncbi:hypothetical protein N7452_000605 [Penicillium brevicompactum]|uniref:Uncharacterized protein n=1 Tax=Penicillium brevicompactum TaxID=5074 RepID=A0A9W9R0V6_PENBR|nr:hypothetical protein N7452_000605 [Penicillium brevicompactum]
MLGKEGIGQSASPARLRFLGTATEVMNPEAEDAAFRGSVILQRPIATATAANARWLKIPLRCLFQKLRWPFKRPFFIRRGITGPGTKQLSHNGPCMDAAAR